MRGGTRQFREPTPGSRLLSLAEAGLPRRTDLRRQEVQHHRGTTSRRNCSNTHALETPSSWSLQRYAGNEFHDEARQREYIRSCRHRDQAWYRDHHHSTQPARRQVRRRLHTLLSTCRREDRYLNSYLKDWLTKPGTPTQLKMSRSKSLDAVLQDMRELVS